MVKRSKRASKATVTISAVTRGSKNVFADLGFEEEAGELQIKAELTRQMCLRIEQLGLTQASASRQLGIGQPDVSKLIRGRYTGFSVERLISLLNSLEIDVEIVLRTIPKNGCYHRGSVTISQVDI